VPHDDATSNKRGGSESSYMRWISRLVYNVTDALGKGYGIVSLKSSVSYSHRHDATFSGPLGYQLEMLSLKRICIGSCLESRSFENIYQQAVLTL
jgi:hypothetical protein